MRDVDLEAQMSVCVYFVPLEHKNDTLPPTKKGESVKNKKGHITLRCLLMGFDSWFYMWTRVTHNNFLFVSVWFFTFQGCAASLVNPCAPIKQGYDVSQLQLKSNLTGLKAHGKKQWLIFPFIWTLRYRRRI